MSTIVLDLEWNDGKDSTKFSEIIQIAAVKTDFLGGKISDSFNAFVSPFVHKKFGKAAAALPIIDDVFENGRLFPSVINDFLKWCGDNPEFVLWGTEDLKVLHKNIEYWNLDIEVSSEYTNIQKTIHLIMGSLNEVSLSTAVDFFKIPNSLDFHNALNDAFYTAVLCEIGIKLKEYAVPISKKSKEIKPSIPNNKMIRTRQRKNGYNDIFSYLDSQFARKQLCPVCSKEMCVSTWSPIPNNCYMNRLTCENDGKFYFLAIPKKASDGTWGGRTYLIMDINLAKELYSNRDKSHPHSCKKFKTNRKKQYWYFLHHNR